MSLLQLATDTLIDALRVAVCANVVLIAQDDIFEVKKTPCLILQGPKLTEHAERRTMDQMVSRNIQEMTCQVQDYPQLYHCDFEVLLTCAKQDDLFDLQTKLLSFVQRTPWLEATSEGQPLKFALVEQTPLGGLRKPNLSNLRQMAGMYRIEDVPVYGGVVKSGKLIGKVVFELRTSDSTAADPTSLVEVEGEA